MVANICQLTLKFKYYDKNCICIFIKLFDLLSFHNKLFNFAKKSAFKTVSQWKFDICSLCKHCQKKGLRPLENRISSKERRNTYSKDQIIRAVLNPPHVDVSFLYLLKATFRGYNITINFNQFLVNQF